jgi:hypothetical protein
LGGFSLREFSLGGFSSGGIVVRWAEIVWNGHRSELLLEAFASDAITVSIEVVRGTRLVALEE